MPEIGRSFEGLKRRFSEVFKPREAELQKMLDWSEVRKPVFILDHIKDGNELQFPMRIIYLAEEEHASGNRKLAGSLLNEARCWANDASSNLVKARIFVRISEGLSKIGNVKLAKEYAAIAEHHGVVAMKESTYGASTLTEVEKGERIENLISVAKLYRDFGMEGGKIDYVMKRAGDLTDESVISEVALKLVEQGFDKEGFDLSSKVHTQSDLVNIAGAFVMKGKIGDGLSVAGRITEGAKLADFVGILLRSGDIGLAMSVAEGVTHSNLNEVISGHVKNLIETKAVDEVSGFIKSIPDKVVFLRSHLFSEAVTAYGNCGDQEKREFGLKMIEERISERANSEEKINILIEAGEAFLKIGDVDRSRASILRAEEIWRGGVESNNLITMARGLFWVGEDDKALAIVNERLVPSLSGYEEYSLEKLASLITCGAVLQKSGEAEMSGAYLREAVETELSHRDYVSEVAIWFTDLGCFDKARELIERGETPARFFGEVIGAFLSGGQKDMLLDILEKKKGLLPEAVAEFSKRGILGDIKGMLDNCGEGERFGVVYALVDCKEPGLALELASKTTLEPRFRSSSYETLARLLVENGFYAEALSIQNEMSRKAFELSVSDCVFKNYSEGAMSLYPAISGFKKKAELLRRESQGKIIELTDLYVSRRREFDRKYSNTDISQRALYKQFRKGKSVPEERLLEGLMFAGIGTEAYLQLYPEQTRDALRRKYNPTSGYILGQCYDGILDSETKAFLERSDIDFRPYVRDWNMIGRNRMNAHFYNLQRMREMEAHFPGEKPYEYLHKLFGVSYFSRYPLALVEDIYRERDDISMPFGVIVAAKADWNTGFYGMEDVWDEFYGELKGKYRLKIVEASNKFQIAWGIVHLVKRYGFIGFMVIAAHGSRESMGFGEGDDGVVSIKDFVGGVVEKLKDRYYVPKMPIAFVSCETAQEEGLVQAASKAFESNARGPKIVTRTTSLVPVFKGYRITDLKTQYASPDAGQKYSAGLPLR